MQAAEFASPGGNHTPSDARKSSPSLVMILEVLVVEVVPENQGQLPSEEPLAAQADTASGRAPLLNRCPAHDLAFRSSVLVLRAITSTSTVSSRRAVARREHDSIDLLPHGHWCATEGTPKDTER